MKSRACHISVWLLLPCFVLLNGCGNPPGAPTEQRGSIEAAAVLLPDSVAADSINVILDTQPLGEYSNPCLIENVYAGKHLLEVSAQLILTNDTLEYYGSPQLVEVHPDQKTSTFFALSTDLSVAPYEGYLAPGFELYDLDSNQVSLEGLSGEVVLLYFFTST
ncbi:MAG: hypothetical protein ABH878_04850 [bacterium]